MNGPRKDGCVDRKAQPMTDRASRIRETRENDERMESCPSSYDCEAPKCPLDALIEYRVFRPGDAKCKAHRITRLKLGASLPMKGLTRREYRGVTEWYGSWDAFVKARGWKYGLKPEVA